MSIPKSLTAVFRKTGRTTFLLLLLAPIVAVAAFGVASRSAKRVEVNKRSDSSARGVPDRSKVLVSDTAQSDNLWTDVNDPQALVQMQEPPKSYRALKLDENLFSRKLAEAPMEFTPQGKLTNSLISLPLPDGRLWRFKIVESPVLSGDLSANFPEIKTYSGQSLDDPTATVRFSWTPRGLNAFVISEQGSFLVVPANQEDRLHYVSYFTHDLDMKPFDCLNAGGTSDKVESSAIMEMNATVSNGGLRRYRLAVSVTPEFIFTVGGNTEAGTVAAVMTYVNNVRAIYEREAGVSFDLVAVWNPAAFGVPLLNGASFAQLATTNAQNQLFLDNLFFGGFQGSASYDIGVAFGYSQNPIGLADFGSGGEAIGIGAACDPGYKARASMIVSGPSTNDYLGSVLIAHELGHMFGGRHTFTPIFSSCTADPSGRYEPGSGSTIMSYASSCLGDNLFTNEPRNAANGYFHIHSLLKIRDHKAAFSTCGQNITTGNSAPVITTGGTGAIIPALTPFTLTAAATDPNGDALTYSWEEWDQGSTIFRSYVPTSSGSRTFPSLTYILNNANNPPVFVNGFFSGEALPSVTGTLHFTVTVRDNRSGGGGTAARDQLLDVNVVGTAGPFRVTQPNTPSSLASGSQTTITWNVANTNFAPISTSAVRILLSTDGGNTFPTVLASSTPNDGSHVVTLPNVQTTTARVKVEAVGNIYFDISDTNFAISNTSANLTPHLRAGWSDKIVVSTVTGTMTDSATLRTTDTLFVDFAVINNGTATTGATFLVKLFVDGVERNTWQSNALDPNGYAFVEDYSIGSLSAGTHTLRIVADTASAISESNESDNEYTKTITVISPVLTNLTPYQPSGWSDKIVVSTGTGTKIDSSPLRPTDTLWVDWAAINNGTSPTGAIFFTKLYVDGVERNSWFTNPPLGLPTYTLVEDYSIGSLSVGTHTLRIVTDATNVIAETNESDNEYTKTIVVSAAGATIQLSAASYSVSESSNTLTVTVTRTGDTSAPATVKYATTDTTNVNFNCNPATPGQITGAASRKCDYHLAVGRLRFAAGETSKQIILSIVNDIYVEPSESFTITLSNPTGATLGTPNTATVNITDNDVTGQANPINGTAFYVRMLYVDLLSREPDPAGFAGWVHRIDFCGQPGEPPPPCDRVTVGGDGFLRSAEFFEREFFVIRLYRAGLGRILVYNDVGDLAYVSGFLTASDLELNKQELVAEIMSRSEFSNSYNGLSNSGYVDKLIQTAAVTIPTSVRDGWVSALNGGTKTRAQVYRELSERQEVTDKYLREAQVVSCYYGFFTRNPDGAYFTYLDRLNRGEITLGDLANAFINAAEYRQRFGP